MCAKCQQPLEQQITFSKVIYYLIVTWAKRIYTWWLELYGTFFHSGQVAADNFRLALTINVTSFTACFQTRTQRQGSYKSRSWRIQMNFLLFYFSGVSFREVKPAPENNRSLNPLISPGWQQYFESKRISSSPLGIECQTILSIKSEQFQPFSGLCPLLFSFHIWVKPENCWKLI